MTIKDSFEVVGMPATCGVPELAQHRPQANALAVQRLVDAGAVVFGKTNLPIWASDLQSYNAVYGTTNNPWDLGRTPGGSSGGAAAAVAAGLSPIELGSDIGGSIRTPAHFCGLFGHKTTWDTVPMIGHLPPPPGVPYTPTDMGVAGPLARTADDLELVTKIIVGPAPGEAPAYSLNLPPARTTELGRFRVAAWLDDPALPVDSVVRARLEAACDALERAGCTVDRRARPAIDARRAFNVYLMLLYGVLGAGMPPEVVTNAAERLKGVDPKDPSPAVATLRGLTLSHRDWIMLHAERTALRAAWAAFFESHDVLLCPAAPVPAFPHDQNPDFAARRLVVDGRELPYMDAGLSWAGLIGMVWLPSTVAPVGRTAQGLPVGMQIVGPHLGDLTTIAFARHVEAVLGGFEAPPGYV